MTAAAVVTAIPPEVSAAAGRGWRMFPVEAKGKLPLVKGWPEAATSDIAQLEAWQHQHPACNWGLATGKSSGLVVIDVDGAEGRASLADLERQGFTLPETLTVTTGRTDGGEHRYFRLPFGVEVRNDQSGKIGAHIDVRGTGGFVVCPPSIHSSGKQYRLNDPDALIADLPTWTVERLTVCPPMPTATAQASPQAVGKGSRTNTLVSLAGTLRKRGADPATIEAALLAENEAKCDPPLPEAKVRKIAADIVKRYPPGEPIAPVIPTLPPMPLEAAARITGELLEKCQTWIQRYIIVSEEQAVILAVWLLHTHAFDAAETTPYIHITAPEKSCGKTRVLETLEPLAAAPIRCGGMTAAALVRTIEAKKPSLFLDEMDAQLGGDKEFAEAVRGILNEGFRKGGVFYKCVGKDFELKPFYVFCPKMFAGIGALPDTVSSRSIVIEMHRKLPGETVEPFRRRAVKAAAAPIRAALEGWAAQGAISLLREIEPAPIANLSDRQNDIAEPLLCIAQLAGAGWPHRLTVALRTVLGAAGAEDGSIGVTLLFDIRAVFDECKADGIPSKELAAALCEIEGRPWAEWNRGRGLTANTLAAQLKKYSIHPQTVRVTDKTPKGYRRADFEDSWARYCAPPRFKTQHRHNPRLYWLNPHFQNATHPPLLRLQKVPQTRMNKGVWRLLRFKTGGTGQRAFAEHFLPARF